MSIYHNLSIMLKSPELIALGKVIRYKREATGISQENFAHDLDFSRSYYWQVEHGRINLGLLKIIKIAKGLKTTASELIKEAEDTFPKRKR